MAESLSAFLEPFPAHIVAAVDAARDAGAIVAGADRGLHGFRRHPGASLARMSTQLDELSRATPSPGRLVWCQTGDPPGGLDDYEVSAVLGRRLYLDFVHQISAGHEKRVVAVGTWRDERVGVCFSIGRAATEAQIVGLLTMMSGQPVPVAVVFVTAAAAAMMIDRPAVVTAVRAVEASGARLGLCVPAEAMAGALADPDAHIAPLRALCGEPPRCVRFADGARLDAAAVDRFMRTTGCVCDISMPLDEGASPAGALTRDAAYAGGSPYRPQPFDLRVPWFQCDARMWFELPAQPVTAATIERWWASRRGVSDDALAPLLDLERMEAYYRLSRIAPDQERYYSDVRIYNWPSPAPAVCTALIDGGEATLDQARDLLDAISRLVAGNRARVVDHDTLLGDARREVEARYATSAAQAIGAQHAAHSYLEHVPHDAPLRQDYAEFARFVPADLGDALEIGSGYGVLAWALSPRARRYACVDLNSAMFGALRRDLGQFGVIADMHKLPFATAAFDSVIANNVLEHLYDPLTGLREIRRVLKPGGRLLALVPLDALNSRHELTAHHWKADKTSVERALAAAGFDAMRLDVVNLYDLGVSGSFPSCHGYAVMIDARHPEHSRATAGRPGASTREPAPRVQASRRVAGRHLPSVREIVQFERRNGRRVVAVSADAGDLEEFRHFGSLVVPVDRGMPVWPLADATADLVYAFLTLTPIDLPRRLEEIRRVLAPGGTVVAVFHHRDGLRYLSRVRSYFGDACDLTALAGADALAQLADDAAADAEYASCREIADAFDSWRQATVSVHNLTPDDVLASPDTGYPQPFWAWLASTCGRYVCVSAAK